MKKVISYFLFSTLILVSGYQAVADHQIPDDAHLGDSFRRGVGRNRGRFPRDRFPRDRYPRDRFPRERISLERSAMDLNSAVQLSSLRWRAKSSVRRFAFAVRNWTRCSRRGRDRFPRRPRDPFPRRRWGMAAENYQEKHDDSFIDHDDFRRPGRGGYYGNCRRLRRRVHYTFREVERYLHDTHFDYPYIYRLFKRTQRALYRF